VDPCTYTLDGDVAHLEPAQTTVTITSRGATHDVPHDPANGWEFDVPGAPQELVLRGAACDEMTRDASATVATTFGCT
jgi:hypothetical protein